MYMYYSNKSPHDLWPPQGSTELTLLPLTSSGKLWKVTLNCKQSRILRVTVENQYSAKYSYVDPLLSVCPPETKK